MTKSSWLPVVLLGLTTEAAWAGGHEIGILPEWRYYEEVRLPAKVDRPNVDFVLGPSVFDGADPSLRDVRIVTAEGADLPYALRERREQSRVESLEARPFNRLATPDGASEVSLDLGEKELEHNHADVQLPGDQYCRRALLEGSPDGQDWRRLAEEYLVRFDGCQRRGLDYAPSRFRYLRLRVWPDPVHDKEPVKLDTVAVQHRVELPGEWLTLPAQLGAREPVRAQDRAASAWILDLGGKGVPCERIELDVADADFVRDYQVFAGGPEGVPDSHPFSQLVGQGTWQRRTGDKPAPLVASLNQGARAARLKLVVIDDANPPLDVRSVSFAAPAWQLVIAGALARPGLRLYFGNPRAMEPNYDFARNLPARLDPPLERAALGPRVENPDFVPAPLPLTERWPAAVYAVLGAISVTLGVLVVQVARASIAVHDAQNE